MKIVAGLGSIDEYIAYVEAGADEVFCGYVPYTWYEKYGNLLPLNRREVRYYNVQIGSMEELRILSKMMEVYKVPVTMAFNALFYTGEQYAEIAEIMKACADIGFDSFIVADPALLIYLREKGFDFQIHISGEMAEINTPFLKSLQETAIKRIIFHRKNSLEDMKSCISSCDFIPEYEAFFLNEMCHFTGGYCQSLHCDELCHMCYIPNKLGTYDEDDSVRLSVTPERHFNPAEQDYLTGETGCALCALWKLKKAGVTHLKLVGRGNYTEDMIRDIKQVRKAIEILSDAPAEEDYIRSMKAALFEGECSGVCYYR